MTPSQHHHAFEVQFVEFWKQTGEKAKPEISLLSVFMHPWNKSGSGHHSHLQKRNQVLETFLSSVTCSWNQLELESGLL